VRKLRSLSLFNILFVFLFPAVALSAPHLMVTAFEPWKGFDANRSLDTAEAMKKELAKSGIVVDICVIPVVYDKASERALDCYNKLYPKPAAAISLGEGGCEIWMETAAKNQDAAPGSPDNMGDIRTNKIIEPGGPTTLSFGGFVEKMYCSLPKSQRDQIVISASAGGFVCNNTAYHLETFFNSLKIPYTFFHVPQNACSVTNDLSIKAGQTIASMVRSLPEFNSSLTNQINQGDLNQCSRLPTTIQQVNAIIKILSHEEKTTQVQCEMEFSERLKERFSQWQNPKLTY
jgi:pyrrolidone-carboxylate peptidase